MRKSLCLATALLAVAQTVSAQSVAGTWNVDYAVRMMAANNEPSPSETVAKVKLVLEQKGESVFRTWQMTAPRESPVQQLRGKMEGKSARLFGVVTGKMRGPDGSDRELSMTQEFEITVTGDSMSGTMKVHPGEGVEIQATPRSFTGKRSS